MALNNILLAVSSGLFVYAHALNFLRYWLLSNLLILTKEALSGYYFVARRAPLKTSTSPYDWAVGIGSTLVPLFLRPVERPYDYGFADLLQVIGLLSQIAGMISINRSFGIVAANRGIRTEGLYRVVRHPLYAAYFVDYLGYFINNFSLRNGVILAVTTLLQIKRMFIEEAFLKQDIAYAEYMKRTHWRLIPFVY